MNLGGLHYCIVLEKFDNPKNGTLTVVPLTSKKSNKVYNKCTLDLGKEIYEILKNKIHLSDEIKKLNKESIVLLNQITTISKKRIFNEDFLYKVKISENTLQLLDNKIIRTFTYTNISMP